MKAILILFLVILSCACAALAQSSPEEAFDGYKNALQKADVKEYLSLVTQESRRIVNPSAALMPSGSLP
jgi:Skp family chaperone for outer membrane proteins